MRQIDAEVGGDILAAVNPSAAEPVSGLADERREELRFFFKVDAGKAESHLDEKVRQTVDEVLNEFLEAEAD